MSKEDLKILEKFAESVNVADDLDDEKLREISDDVLHGYEEDLLSVEDWRASAKRALELTELEREVKNFPMRNSSNVKYPLITTAVIQFAARTLPELIKSSEVAKYKIIGKDPSGRKDRLGKRIQTHLNYQLLDVIPNWLDEHDKLLTHLGVIGTVYTKTWFDPINGINKSELIPYDEIIVNDGIKSLEEAERISHIINMSENEIVEHQRFGLFSEVEDGELNSQDDSLINIHELIEQHCFLDLDEDGYKEPYIVTVHKPSGTVLRIVARYSVDSILVNDKDEIMKIFGKDFFNDYHFIPNPAARFHGIGFGTLLLDMNESVNTIMNQLIDAGKLANIQGGFIGAGMRLRSKTIDLEPGEWLALEAANGDSIKNNIVPLSYKEPSSVLLSLLSLLINASEGLTSTTTSITPEEAHNTSPNTMLALIQQGLKVFTSIQRRIFRGFKKELKKMVELNALFLDPEEYIRVVDPTPQELEEMIDPQTGQIMDYLNPGIDVVPVADINAATEAERLAKSQSELMGGIQLAQIGGCDPKALGRSYFKNLDSDNLDELVPPANPNEPNVQLIELQAKLDVNSKELALKEQEMKIRMVETEYKIKEMASKALKNIADAEAAEVGTQLDGYKAFLESVLAVDKAKQGREDDGQTSEAGDASGTASELDGASIDEDII